MWYYCCVCVEIIYPTTFLVLGNVSAFLWTRSSDNYMHASHVHMLVFTYITYIYL